MAATVNPSPGANVRGRSTPVHGTAVDHLVFIAQLAAGTDGSVGKDDESRQFTLSVTVYSTGDRGEELDHGDALHSKAEQNLLHQPQATQGQVHVLVL